MTREKAVDLVMNAQWGLPKGWCCWWSGTPRGETHRDAPTSGAPFGARAWVDDSSLPSSRREQPRYRGSRDTRARNATP